MAERSTSAKRGRTKAAKRGAKEPPKESRTEKRERIARERAEAEAFLRSASLPPEVIEEHVLKACPGYKVVESRGTNFPSMTFQRPAPKGMSQLEEHISLQSNVQLEGAWIRVSYYPYYIAPGANGPAHHFLYEGWNLGPAEWKTHEARDAALEKFCARLEPKALEAFAAPERHYEEIEALFDPLLEHYARFLQTDATKLRPWDFFETKPDSHEVVALDAFIEFLKKEKLLFREPKLELEDTLMRFWYEDRPLRMADYRRGYGFYCVKCFDEVLFEDGKVEKRHVDGFGTHYVFFCGRH